MTEKKNISKEEHEAKQKIEKLEKDKSELNGFNQFLQRKLLEAQANQLNWEYQYGLLKNENVFIKKKLEEKNPETSDE